MANEDVLSFLGQPEVALAYYYEDYYRKNPPAPDPVEDETYTVKKDLHTDAGAPMATSPFLLDNEHASPPNRTLNDVPSHAGRLARRAPTSETSDTEWALSQLSNIPGKTWPTVAGGSKESYTNGDWEYKYNYNNDPAGAGQVVYLLNEIVVWTWHPEFQQALAAGRIRQLPGRAYDPDELDDSHGSCVASRIMGEKLGVCKMCTLVWVGYPTFLYRRTEGVVEQVTTDMLLEQLTATINDVQANNLQGKAVLNLSGGARDRTVPNAIVRQMRALSSLLFGVCSSSANPLHPQAFSWSSSTNWAWLSS